MFRKIKLTTDNLDEKSCTMPVDQSAEAYPGCIHYQYKADDQECIDVTLYPKTFRVAVCEGESSKWGNYRGYPDVHLIVIALDDGADVIIIDEKYKNITRLTG